VRTTPSTTTAGAGSAGNALTLAVRLKPNRREPLRQLLEAYGGDIRNCRDITFAQLETVHFLRFVIIGTDEDGGDGTLVLESNHDGSFDAHVDDLLRAGAAGFHAIFRHCVGYPVDQEALAPADFPAVKAYLAGLRLPRPNAFHVGVHGKSATEIHLEAKLVASIGRFLDERRRTAAWPPPPRELYDQIHAHVVREGFLPQLAAGCTETPPARTGRMVLGLAGLVAPYLPLAPLLPVGLATLLWKERRDAQASYTTDPAGTERLAAREDQLTQNQLTHLVAIKPGPFRRWLVRFVLAAIDTLARFQFNQGRLGGISTIHYARWVVVDQGRQLLFFSNYDGSWESYLGDFIDKAADGLTGIWSNTVGFPRTRWLVRAGARDEERFKAWTRAHQVPTPLWYSAYPDLTVRNIQQNHATCRGLLQAPADAAALDRWLGGL
jgi:hypothetical protein